MYIEVSLNYNFQKVILRDRVPKKATQITSVLQLVCISRISGNKIFLAS